MTKKPLKNKKDTSVIYVTDLNLTQTILLKVNMDGVKRSLRKYTAVEIINAIANVVRTGCQWSMLPKEFPHWKAAYHHFRSLSDRGWFKAFLRVLVEGRRSAMGQHHTPYGTVMDSQSVRSALPDSEKGIDGNKRIKGIKRHVAVESNGYVLDAVVTTANVHDSKGAIPLTARVLDEFKDITEIKADLGYASLKSSVDVIDGVVMECVKSNFGTPDFIPIQGRRVVERTFSWMDGYRRLTRNYERRLSVARHMFIAGCVFFMLRYFA